MRLILKIAIILALIATFATFLSLVSEKDILRNNLIRLHVVADSDSAQDQSMKLQVRDAVLSFVQNQLASIPDAEAAKAFLSENLKELETVANETLAAIGSTDTAKVTLEEECFPMREYDTFSLPSGVYESLRVTIGSGAGKNWWCVVFPALCVGAVTEEFQQTAATAGFSDTLTDTLAGEDGYEISFFLLDCLGKLENFFHLH